MDQDGYLRGSLYGEIERRTGLAGEWHALRRDVPTRGRRAFDWCSTNIVDEDEPGLVIVIGIADAVLGETRHGFACKYHPYRSDQRKVLQHG